MKMSRMISPPHTHIGKAIPRLKILYCPFKVDRRDINAAHLRS